MIWNYEPQPIIKITDHTQIKLNELDLSAVVHRDISRAHNIQLKKVTLSTHPPIFLF